MDLPLPKVVSDVEAGGPLVTAMRGRNALQELMLMNKAKEIENQFSPEKNRLANEHQGLINKWYGPNIESDIGHRNALTNEVNKMLPGRLEELQQKNQMYIPNIKSEMANRNALTNKYNTMTPLEAEEMRIKTQYLPQSEQARINYQNMGGGRGGVDLKNAMSFVNQIKRDNPGIDENRANEIASAAMEGSNTLPDGSPAPKLSGMAQDLLTKIQKKNAPVAVQNQAANYDVLYNGLKDFDIDAVKAMAGPEGRAKLAYAKMNMISNPNDPNIDPMARRFLSSMNESIINMDKMRKAFGTSVVPEYVYKTVGRLTNPADSIFNDAKQIGQNYESVLKSIKKDRDSYMAKAQHGIGASSKEENPSSKMKELTYDINTGEFV